MSKPTPGPWTAFYKHKYDEWHVSIPMPNSYTRLALFNDGVRTENPEADARLIAAAPELLEACEAAKKYLEPDLVEPGRTVFWKLVAALSKARGAA